MKKKSLIRVLTGLMIIGSLQVNTAHAEEINIPVFRNTITGINSVFTNSNIMKSGWQHINNKWYYLDQSGIAKTGWIYDNGSWYYCNEFGEMVHNQLIDGYRINDSGKLEF